MNRYAKGIIFEFMSVKNRNWILEQLSARYNYDSDVEKFLRENIGANMEHFAEQITQEMLVSDPLPGVTMVDQLNCFNRQFLEQESRIINDAVLELVDETPVYQVTDGISTTRYGLTHYQGKPDDILKSWWLNSGRTAQARDDTPGDFDIPDHNHNEYYNDSAVGDVVGHHTGFMNGNSRSCPSGRYANSKSTMPIYDSMQRAGRTPTIESMSGRDMRRIVENDSLRENYTNGPIWSNSYTTASVPYNSAGYVGGGDYSRGGTQYYNANGPTYGRGVGNNGSHGQQALNDPTSVTTRYPYAAAPVRCGGIPSYGAGITFSDQSEIGTSNHVSQYENTAYKVWLNNAASTLPHEHSVFGDSTADADNRLLSRRTFRSNFATDNPIENAIPTYEVRLQRRAIDREISENLHNAEKGCKLFSHDMNSLYDRIDRKRVARSQYDPARWPTCKRVPDNHGGNVDPRRYTQLAGDLPVPGNRPRVTDDARYC